MLILTYQKLYNKIKNLKNPAYNSGILTIIEDGQERGFGIRKYNDSYIYGDINLFEGSLDDFGFDIGFIKISKDIDDVILGYIEYFSDDINDKNVIWNGVELRYNVPATIYFKCFKDGDLSIKLDLDDYNITEWEE